MSNKFLHVKIKSYLIKYFVRTVCVLFFRKIVVFKTQHIQYVNILNLILPFSSNALYNSPTLTMEHFMSVSLITRQLLNKWNNPILSWTFVAFKISCLLNVLTFHFVYSFILLIEYLSLNYGSFHIS